MTQSPTIPSEPTLQVRREVSKQDIFLTFLCIEEFTKDEKKFFKNAEEFTKKNSEKRPSD